MLAFYAPGGRRKGDARGRPREGQPKVGERRFHLRSGVIVAGAPSCGDARIERGPSFIGASYPARNCPYWK